MLDQMDLKLLQVFVSVVKTGSISAAARQLNFSQPAVSQQVKNLERDLGAQLFIRESGRLELTTAGKMLQDYAEDTLSNWQFVAGQVSAASGRQDVTTFHLGTFPSANLILVEALEAMLRVTPSLRIEITDVEPPANFELLQSAQCDALVTFNFPNDDVPRGFRTIPVISDSFVLLVPQDHPFAQLGQVSLADARNEKWIAGCPRCRKELVQFCLDYGWEPEVLCATDDLEATCHFVAAGMGIALRPTLNVLSRPLPGVAVVGIEDSRIRQISVMVRGPEVSPLANTLAELMRDVATHLVDSAPENQRSWFQVLEQ